MKDLEKGKFNNNFNILRLLAAIQVFCFHSFEHLEVNYGKIITYFTFYRGVIIFFTISGYLVFASLDRNRENIKQYILNRVGRIYPALWFSTLLSIVTILSVYKIENITSFFVYIFGQLTIFQFWTPAMLRGYGVSAPNGSLWTIVVELQFYFILIFIYFKCNTKIKLGVLFLFSVIFNVLIGLANETIIIKLLKVSIFPYLYNFLIGSIFYKFTILKKKLLDNKFIYWFLICQLFYILDIFPGYFPNFFGFIANTVLSITVLSFAFSYTNYIKELKMDISYGVYLYHMVFLNFFIQKYGVEEIKNSYLWLIYIIIVFVVSIFSHYCVEEPILSFFKKKKINEINV